MTWRKALVGILILAIAGSLTLEVEELQSENDTRLRQLESSVRDVQAALDLARSEALASPKIAGTYVVGTEMEPGEWTAVDSGPCAWVRIDALGEVVEESSDEAGVVEVAPTDAQVRLIGCRLWVRTE